MLHVMGQMGEVTPRYNIGQFIPKSTHSSHFHQNELELILAGFSPEIDFPADTQTWSTTAFQSLVR